MKERDRLLLALAAAAFLVFFNGYLVAPLLPALSGEFGVDVRTMGWVVPAYMLSYGFSTLFYGPLSDRVGRGAVLLTILAVSIGVTAACGLAPSYGALIVLRVMAGLCAGGLLPIALALIGDLYPYSELGRPMGWMFGAVAGGMAFGSTLGAWLNPVIGWRREFFALAVANALVFALAWQARHAVRGAVLNRRSAREIARGYLSLVSTKRGRAVYSLVFVNGLFHSGIFSWLGFYLFQRYQLSDQGIGEALLGYGLPGMLLGPLIGRLADRFGRRRIIPMGFGLAAACAFALVPVTPLWIPVIAMTLVSFGLDMSHPLMSGIITSLDPARRGQAMGLNAFAIFTGFGLGALCFQLILGNGLGFTLLVFGAMQAVATFAAIRAFRGEVARKPLGAAPAQADRG